MSITSKGIQNKLTKLKRNFNIIKLDDGCTENSYVELFCIKCNKSLGKCNLQFSSIDTYILCNDCWQNYKKITPFKISNDITVLDDMGNWILIRYENIRQEYTKQCYLSKDKRFIKIKCERLFV